MTKGFEENLLVGLSLQEAPYTVAADRDYATMTTRVRAELESAIAKSLAERALCEMVRQLTPTGMSPDLFKKFLEFLARDAETHGRFVAYLAAERINDHVKPD